MAYGLFIFRDLEGETPTVIAKYFKDEIKEKVEINTEMLEKIVKKHKKFSENTEFKKILSYRTIEYKFFALLIQKDDEVNFFTVFILNLTESAEPFSIMLEELQDAIENVLEKETNEKEQMRSNILKKILDNRNELIEDVMDTKRITDRLISQANKLLDEGKFEEAQELIKRAREVPPKIADLVKKGNISFLTKDYSTAKKLFKNAADFAKKINQHQMYQLLNRKAQYAEEIPKFMKDWSSLYKQLNKYVKNIDQRDSKFYSGLLENTNNAIEIFDMLEDDESINDLQKLEDFLQKGEALSEELDNIDSEIINIIEKLGLK
ncbi:MAG: hypothetical protein ACTSWY_08880 [Promethearchaeota archaeon]